MLGGNECVQMAASDRMHLHAVMMTNLIWSYHQLEVGVCLYSTHMVTNPANNRAGCAGYAYTVFT